MIQTRARTLVRYAYQLVEILGATPGTVSEPRSNDEIAEWLSTAHTALSEARSAADSAHRYRADQMPHPPAAILDEIADLISEIQDEERRRATDE